MQFEFNPDDWKKKYEELNEDFDQFVDWAMEQVSHHPTPPGHSLREITSKICRLMVDAEFKEALIFFDGTDVRLVDGTNTMLLRDAIATIKATERFGKVIDPEELFNIIAAGLPHGAGHIPRDYVPIISALSFCWMVMYCAVGRVFGPVWHPSVLGKQCTPVHPLLANAMAVLHFASASEVLSSISEMDTDACKERNAKAIEMADTECYNDSWSELHDYLEKHPNSVASEAFAKLCKFYEEDGRTQDPTERYEKISKMIDEITSAIASRRARRTESKKEDGGKVENIGELFSDEELRKMFDNF